MPMLRTLFVMLLAGLGCLAIPSVAHACSCIYQGPACQAYWTTDAVFDGTVMRIEKIALPASKDAGHVGARRTASDIRPRDRQHQI